MESREVIRRLMEAGWELRKVRGSHHHFLHPTRPGKVTVPHPVKDMKIGTLKAIEKQSGVRLT
jgi:predicted RNA binding protein YcfA (HicA-like mRNA interferase family)